ncbi:hypothetical protein [Streptomyces sp. NPDC127038]|uniref:hypothetical protein n=1 Tax=Streptomyces sp. NPDC127038 TaxID=3347114 RepID=UPI003664049D
MLSMTAVPALTTRTPLPKRPVLHEKTPDRPTPTNPRPHPRHARADAEIGPRRPGAIYQNVDGRFEVLALVTNPREAAQLLRRTSARWAVIVRDTLRPDGIPFAVGSAWTTSDYLLREGRTPAAYVPAA